MRPFDSAADAGRLAELMTATGPEPVTEADVRAWMAGRTRRPCSTASSQTTAVLTPRRTGSHGTPRASSPGGSSFCRFADRHGLGVVRHTLESIVDVSSLRRDALEAPDPPDVTVTTLAELGDTDDHRREIWRIHEESFADEPSRAEAAQRSYEHFTTQLFETDR